MPRHWRKPPAGLIDGRIEAGEHFERAKGQFALWAAAMPATVFLTFGACLTTLMVLGKIDDEQRLALFVPFAGIPFVVMCAISYFIARHRRGVLQRDLTGIRSRDFRVCLHCRYDLSRTPSATTCPECGRPFNPATARASWLWTYRDALPPRDRRAKPWLDAPQPGAPAATQVPPPQKLP